MDGLALITQATDAGLKLAVVDGKLTIRGPTAVTKRISMPTSRRAGWSSLRLSVPSDRQASPSDRQASRADAFA